MPKKKAKPSALYYLLSALIPYSKANLKLSFHPSEFFSELERQSGYKQRSLRNVVYKAEKAGLISRDEQLLKITEEGLKVIEPMVATKLAKDVSLMVIFDVPEERWDVRRRFRLMLKEWQFEQVQKSVWASKYDYRKPLMRAIEELALSECVQVYECFKHYPKV